jgi:hypothetical protein
VPKRLDENQFIKPSCEDSRFTMQNLVNLLEAHEGIFVVDDIAYDSVYCGTDNLYFAYCFNSNTGRAVNETLIIVNYNITIENNSVKLLDHKNKEVTIFLQDP